MMLEFDGVTKFYGPVIGVNEITCQIGAGVTGLFGANGAGKSTLLKLASGQLRPSLGRVRVGRCNAWSSTAKRYLGYSPDINSFYEEMTGRDFVYTMIRLHGYSGREARRRTEKALEEVGMADRAGRVIRGCSHGMRQRIKLAQAIAHDPDVLLLDEPMSGIDPGGRREIGELLRAQADRGKAILISSHVLAEVEALADSILVISRGRIMASGTISDVRNQLDEEPFTVEIVTEAPRRLASLLMAAEEVHSVEVRNDHLTARTKNPTHFFERLAGLALEQDIVIHEFSVVDAGADAVFGYLERGAS